MAGGGGSAGKVDFPPHMKDIHKEFFGYSTSAAGLTVNMTQSMNTAIGTNPFIVPSGSTFINYADPDTDLDAIETELTEFDNKVDALGQTIDLTTAFTRAVTEADTLNVLKTVNVAGIATDTLNAVNTALASINLGTVSSDAISATNTAISTAIAQTIAAVDDTVVAAAVTEFYNKNQLQQGRIIRRFAQGMADVNAVQSSAFFFGMAILEAENSRQTAEYSTQLRVQLHRDVLVSYVDIYKVQLANGIEKAIRTFVPLYQSHLSSRSEIALREKQARDNLVQAAIAQWVQMLYNNINAHQAVVANFDQVKRTRIVATKEYVGDVFDWSEKLSEWPLRVFQYGGSLLGAINGSAAVVPSKPSRTSSTIGGAASGAATGALIGSAVPGIGTALGAGLGALVGGAGGFFS